MHERVRLDPDVVDTELDGGEVVLLHLGTKNYYSLNLTGALVLRGVKDGMTLQQIAERLQNEFDVDGKTAEQSVRDLIQELDRERLVQPWHANTSSFGPDLATEEKEGRP